ncbi:MAG: hypothetical protein IJV19_01425 [Prevotella sp.]|nr:hypothetical protein [Prevotella sp.]
MRYIQNRIAESRNTLPVTATLILGLWLAGLWIRQWEPIGWQFPIVALSTLMMVIVNNENSLIRVYSRMVSCSFLIFTTLIIFDTLTIRGAMCQFLSILFVFLIFRCYQDRQSTGYTFYAFICLSLISMLYIRILFIVPFLWIMMASLIMNANIKTYAASIFGLLTPYWFVAAIAFYRQDATLFTGFFNDFIPSAIADFSSVTTNELVYAAVLVILGLIGSIHFIRYSYRDKIRVRLLYYFFIYIQLFLLVMLVLFPGDRAILLPLLTVSVSPLIAHIATLTSSRLSNILFLVSSISIFFFLIVNTCRLS